MSGQMSGIELEPIHLNADIEKNYPENEEKDQTETKDRHHEFALAAEFKEEADIADGDTNAYQKAIIALQKMGSSTLKKNSRLVKTTLCLIILVLYLVYFGYAMYYRFGDEGSWRLLGVTVFTAVVIVLTTTFQKLTTTWNESKQVRYSVCCIRFQTFLKWFLRIGVLVAIVVYVVLDIAIDHPQNLVSVAGLIIYVLVFYVTSVNPAKVNWHTIFWGIALQYVFALLILRTYWGYAIFKWLGDRVTEILDYSMAGVLFVFGDTYADHFFATKVLSVVVFLFSLTNILYYLGAMQAVIRIIGRFLAFCLGTTPAESISTSANIFVSMVEAPLMIAPFLQDMTRSELHAVMTGGFATIAGSVLGAFISFGVPANHLLSASVMSAPAALAMSKLSYPETEVSKATSKDFQNLRQAPERNIVEAASNGANASLKIIGAIVVNVIAFLSILALFNTTLTFLGNRVGVENLTLEFICSYALYPVSYFMGTDTADCRKVAELIGIKTFTNEFIAYGQLKVLIENRKALNNYTSFFSGANWHWENGDILLDATGQILKGGVLSFKSEVIATYALCGFSNFGAIGITLGGLTALAPTRRTDLSKMVVRAMICGNVACFLTACVAGLLFKEYE